MMTDETKGALTIQGSETEDYTVPVEVLVDLLSGLQQLALLFEAYAENRPLQQRFKPSLELRRRCRLRCGIPLPGSYQVPLELVDESGELPHLKDAVLPRLFTLIEGASRGDRDAVTSVMPDSRYRDRALLTLRSFTPRKGARWTASLSVGSKGTVSLNGNLGRRIDQLLSPGEEHRATLTVTGELVGIEFDVYKLSIRYPVNQTLIECTYLPELEPDLLESRRDLIQVTGEFTLDKDGHPIRLSNVNKIEAVDLTSIELRSIESDGRVLRPNTPLRLTPRLDDETQQLFVVDDESLDLHVFAYTREDLINELSEHIVFAWDAYAHEDPASFSEAAKHLQDAYLSRFEENQDA
jgi:hypothetical protein